MLSKWLNRGKNEEVYLGVFSHSEDAILQEMKKSIIFSTLYIAL
jgi:hypothetical protein